MKITSRNANATPGNLTAEQYGVIRAEYVGQLAEEWIVDRARLIDTLDAFLEERIILEFEELEVDLQALLETRNQLKVARNVIDHLVEENTVLAATCEKLQLHVAMQARLLEKLSAAAD